MFKRTLSMGLIGAVVSGSLLAAYPEVREVALRRYQAAVGWSETARVGDPVGFVGYADGKLRQDLLLMQQTRRDLTAEVAQLATTRREQQALAEQTRQLAGEFRAAYREAVQSDSFPIEVRGQAYTQSQVRSQVSLLLAVAEGHEAALADIESVQHEAEQRVEELAVRISKTESQLALLATKRELLRARQLTSEGEQLLAQVDDLMTGNAQTIAAYPVRTPEELMAARPTRTTVGLSSQQVDEFLTQIPLDEASIADRPSSDLRGSEVRQDQRPMVAPGRQSKPASKREQEPRKTIFQQS